MRREARIQTCACVCVCVCPNETKAMAHEEQLDGVFLSYIKLHKKKQNFTLSPGSKNSSLRDQTFVCVTP